MKTLLSPRGWFVLALALIYGGTFIFSDRLRFGARWDEPDFWRATVYLLDGSQPWWERLRSYGVLSTPLAFLTFGALESLFHGGIFGGRLLNFLLSVGISLAIGFSRSAVSYRSAAAALAMISFPYFLFVSTHLYTEMVAVAFSLAGIWCYERNRHVLAAVAFLLAIAARQYMVAFPAAIFLAEIARSWRGGRLEWRVQWLLPFAAALSLLAWFFYFGGLAPTGAFHDPKILVPLVQRRTLAIDLGSSLYFLGCLGIYFVLPEWLLYRRTFAWRSWLTTRNVAIAIGLLILFAAIPMSRGHGLVSRLALWSHLPSHFSRNVVLFLPALASVVRFSQLHLGTCLVLAHASMMAKAYPWDKYLLPLLVALWYLESRAPDQIGAASDRYEDPATPDAHRHG